MSAEAYVWWMRWAGSLAGALILFGFGLALAYGLWGRKADADAKTGGPAKSADPPDAGEK